MRICFVNPTVLIRRPIAELIGRLGDEHDVAVLVPKLPFSRVNRDWHANDSLKKAKIYTYAAINPPFFRFEWPIPVSIFFFIHLIRIYRKYDIIHLWTFFYLVSFFTALLRPILGKRLILSADTIPGYSFDPGKTTTSLFRIYIKLFRKIVFGMPDKVHLYGASLLRYARVIGVSRKDIAVIPTGIDIHKFTDARPVSRLGLGLKKESIVFVYAGLMVPRKGIDIIIDTMRYLYQEGYPAQALLIGDGPHAETYRKEIDQAGLEKKIIFTGWRKDIPRLFKAADILFLPSRGEGLPGIVMEGMASGLPILSTDIPCIPDLVDDGKNGFLCALDDRKAFRAAAERLVIDAELRKKMGKASSEKIKDFEWNILMQKYLELYRK